MSLSVKAVELVNVNKALGDLVKVADEPVNKVPTKVSYWAIRIKKKLKDEIEAYAEQRDKLLEKFGERVHQPGGLDKDGNKMFVPTNQYQFASIEQMNKFNEEMKKVDDKEILIENVYKIKLSEFKESQKVFSIIDQLEAIIEDDGEPAIDKEEKKKE